MWVISNSNGNSAIDTEQGYAYEGGAVIAIMPQGGMSNEATRCRKFNSFGRSIHLSLSAEDYLLVEIDKDIAIVKMPISINSALVIALGDADAEAEVDNDVFDELDENGVAWN